MRRCLKPLNVTRTSRHSIKRKIKRIIKGLRVIFLHLCFCLRKPTLSTVQKCCHISMNLSEEPQRTRASLFEVAAIQLIYFNINDYLLILGLVGYRFSLTWGLFTPGLFGAVVSKKKGVTPAHLLCASKLK